MAEQLGGMAIQTSAYGRCIPIVYGKARVAANLIFYNDFTAIAHVTSTPTGGKGGRKKYSTDTTWTYTASVALGICEGPAGLTGKVWVDKDCYEENGLKELGMSFFKGELSQSPWPHVASKHPSKAVGYGSTAYAAHPCMDLGSSGSTKNHSFEVMGFCSNEAMGGDANAADVILDMLTHSIHGMGFPASAIAPLSSYREYTRESKLFVTALYDDQKTGLQCLQTLLECTNSIAVWSGGKLHVMPLGDLPIGTWEPNSTPQYALTADDFIGRADPVKVRRKTSADAHNSVKVKFNNRGKDYAEDIAAADDLAMQDLFGVRPAQEFKADCAANADTAQMLAQIHLQRYVGIRNEYEFKLGWRYILLEPGDLVTLTEPGLGLDNTPVRIVTTEESADGDITIVAEDWPNGIATAVAYPAPPRDGNGPNLAVKPGSCNPPVIFEPPGDLTGGGMQAWIGTSGGEWWGGCEIWACRDRHALDATYSMVGAINAPARHGKLSRGMGKHEGINPDNNSELAVDLRASRAALISASQADASHWETLSYAGGELLAYQFATQTGISQYDLKGLRRGLFGSANTAHSSGDDFMRLDSAVAKIDLSRWNAGETIWLKFPSFNCFGQAAQSLDEVEPVPYTITGIALRSWPAPTKCIIAITEKRPE
jgi:hypothetical protein